MNTRKPIGPAYGLTIRIEVRQRPGMLGLVAGAIGRAGGDIGAVDLVRTAPAAVVRDLTVNARDEAHGDSIVAALRRVGGCRVVSVSDRTFLMHLGGKISIQPRVPIKTRDDLSMAYTPGVGRVSQAIAKDPDRAWALTMKRNTVAIVTDGTAVLGLGNLGPLAALPVMEGKSAIFKTFAGVDAIPLCLNVRTPAELIETVIRVAPMFGGINLEDIAAPACFEVEEQLQKALDIPVFHDDQHGTAIVVTAALLNAARVVKKDLKRLRVVVTGVGAAGVATTKSLMALGIRDIVGCDRAGVIWRGREAHMTPAKRWYAARTNPRNLRGSAEEALRGADVYIGLSGPGAIRPRALARMAPRAIVFTLANPDPEVPPEIAARYARVVATGRSDYPNQINNALAFPGVFKGALEVRAKRITPAMEVAAARAIAGIIRPEELSEDTIVPSLFNPRVVPAVSRAVARAAVRGGVSRRALPIS